MASRSRAVIPVLIGLNVAVFLLWVFGAAEARLGDFLDENFLVSRAHLAEGRFWTLLTAGFSHAELWHLALNMMVLHSFGTVLVYRWGEERFVVFHLAAIVVASCGHVVVGLLIGRDQPALGASGAVSAALAAFAYLYPRHRILVFGIVPLPAWLAALVFVGLDVWGVVAQSAGGGLPIGHGAHLGGAVFGLVYSVLTRRPPLSEQELALLVEKLQAGGLESLSPEERARLDEAFASQQVR
jgi:rhomboid-like protein